eukprot:CAMPEP_0197291810 /NCGR_PEP_ID=MMETSP0890-20130614/19185_1 /TAXON_ID=44058 ORGANISM="Aureoumbra lagunensis, Strain CCMP1510" /NCGR_SAMPLE_ID=MMETSP0890 /ASSEMBLY_ACC=CAM_ASM_000533 /LENGTH=101 /DNA_ID=CAMNT_0042765211 /DNA_START=147 /DNA_END=452 /DNA_ORIENTATION=+
MAVLARWRRLRRVPDKKKEASRSGSKKRKKKMSGSSPNGGGEYSSPRSPASISEHAENNLKQTNQQLHHEQTKQQPEFDETELMADDWQTVRPRRARANRK